MFVEQHNPSVCPSLSCMYAHRQAHLCCLQETLCVTRPCASLCVLQTLVHALINPLCTGCRGSLAGPNEDTHTHTLCGRVRV